MAWLIVLPVLILPFVFAFFLKQAWGRLGLAAVWLTCAGGAVFFCRGASELDAEQRTEHRYELPSTPGIHTVPIRRLRQGSMLGVLAGGEGRPAKKDLERLRWSMPADAARSWFDLGPNEDIAETETPLFLAALAPESTSVPLSYQVAPADAGLLASRVLLVRHDSSAIHMLRDHGPLLLRGFAGAAGVWGAIWFLVQALSEVRRFRRPNVETPQAP